MYRYETHLHTYPVSRCAKAGVRESLEFYKELGYDGVFITNHFLDSNINIEATVLYKDQIDFYFTDYEEAVMLEKEIGIKVFCGVEMSYAGTDFLVYGLDKEWYLAHPEIMDMKKNQELLYLMESGALVIHAHPFHETTPLDHLRLYPRFVHGVEVINANRPERVNCMARIYAENYDLIKFAGTDNHLGKNQKKLAGMCSEEAILSESDFVARVKNKQMNIFSFALEQDDAQTIL